MCSIHKKFKIKFYVIHFFFQTKTCVYFQMYWLGSRLFLPPSFGQETCQNSFWLQNFLTKSVWDITLWIYSKKMTWWWVTKIEMTKIFCSFDNDQRYLNQLYDIFHRNRKYNIHSYFLLISASAITENTNWEPTWDPSILLYFQFDWWWHPLNTEH